MEPIIAPDSPFRSSVNLSKIAKGLVEITFQRNVGYSIPSYNQCHRRGLVAGNNLYLL
jgi:hypothetical protein